MISWITLYPELYRSEREQVEKNYPNLKLCTSLLETGVLAYHGEILVRGSGGTKRHKIVFKYPTTFPYHLPIVVPVQTLPEGEPHPKWRAVTLIRNARHQMADGGLCLIEQDPFRQSGEIISGVNILRRAEAWFFSVDSGANPYDSPEADIQAHMPLAADILIGPEFYDPDLKVGGLFYAGFAWGARELQARYLGLSISSDFSDLAVFRDSRKTLGPPFPWVRDNLWDAAQSISQGQSKFNELLEGGAVIRGIWWDLPKEPLPPRKGSDLLRLVSEAGYEATIEKAFHELRLDIYKELYLFFAFRFPGRNDGFDWLFTAVKLREESPKESLILDAAKKRKLVERGKVMALRRHPLLRQPLALRNKGRVPETLADKKISLLGSGALGSVVGDLLVKAGVGAIFIYDKDIMEVGNSVRHVAGVESFGLPKAGATALKLIQHNPFTDIQVGQGDLLASFETLESALADADLAVSTTADESVESAVNEVATRIGKPIYYARALRGGSSGRIFRVIPGRDACRYCLAYYMGKGEGHEELGAWLNVPDDESTVLAYECGNPILASSGADLTLIGSLAVRIVLDDLKSGFRDANHWLWATEGIESHPSLSEAYKLNARSVPPYPGCPFCSDPPIKKVFIPHSVKSFMHRLASDAKGNEVCGILVGYFRDDGTVEVVEASDAGPNAKSSPTGCWRDVDYVQGWVDEKLRLGDERLRYVGEWHSHPSTDTRPSHIDVESLTGIASSQNYLCPSPVMVVLGLSRDGEEKVSAYSFAAGRPYREIIWEVC